MATETANLTSPQGEPILRDCIDTLRRVASYCLPRALDQRLLWLSENKECLDEAQREEHELAYRAVPVDGDETAAAVNRAMAEKYGATDRFYSRLFPRERAVVVRLDPVEGSGTLAGEHAGAHAPATP